MMLGQEQIVALGDAQTDRYWQHHSAIEPDFRHEFFDDRWLSEAGAVVGLASAGRGNTQLLSLAGQSLVLRHYKRGGYASKVSQDRYLWTGLDSARPFIEFAMLVHLRELDLPAAKPYAAQVVRSGASYSGSLITYRLPGITLAEAFVGNHLTPALWHLVGVTIASFHAQGIHHADLNAHNILIQVDADTHSNASAPVALLDFDRASIKDPVQREWQHKTLSRLQRSLLKIADRNQLTLQEIDWQTLIDGAHGKQF